MTQLMCFVLCVLGSKAILDVWFLGSIFANYRAWAELFRDEGKWRLTKLLGELLSCRFCFSYHSSLWMTLCFIPVIPWWGLLPWWLAVRTTTGFLDTFEALLERTGEDNVEQSSSAEHPGTLRDGNKEGFFD